MVAIATPSLFGLAFVARDLPVVRSYINLLLAGIIAGHPELDRTDLLTPSGESAYDALAAADVPDGYCESPNFDIDADLKVDPLTLPAWKAAFEANYPGKARIAVPVLMVQSRADETALEFLAYGVCRDLQANGTDLRMWRYDDEDHVSTVSVSAADRMRWMLDRLAGEPLADTVPFTGEEPEVLTTCPGSGTTTPPGTGSTTTSPPPRPSTPTSSTPIPSTPKSSLPVSSTSIPYATTAITSPVTTSPTTGRSSNAVPAASPAEARQGQATYTG